MIFFLQSIPDLYYTMSSSSSSYSSSSSSSSSSSNDFLLSLKPLPLLRTTRLDKYKALWLGHKEITYGNQKMLSAFFSKYFTNDTVEMLEECASEVIRHRLLFKRFFRSIKNKNDARRAHSVSDIAVSLNILLPDIINIITAYDKKERNM